MFRKIELDAPNVGEIEKEYLCKAVDSGFISSVGPFVTEFEKKVTDYVGAKGAVAVQSGTAAIRISLYEAGIGPGDEVIVPALTFAATVNPVLYVGATPVIVDVDSNTWNMDPVKIKEAITTKTKAIIPVHLYGNPCNMKEIIGIAREYGLYVIEDATESLGAKFNDKYTGAFGDFGCFSFNGNKLITTGGGGMVVGDDLDKIEHIRYLVNQAKDKERPGFHSEIGFNSRMTNIEAALGLAQFEKINKFLEKKEVSRTIYQKVLGDLPWVSFQDKYTDAIESWWFTCIKVEKEINIPELMQSLKRKNIPSRRIFMPLNEMPYLKEYSANCPNASEIYDDGMCLPSSTLNTEEDIQETALMIREVLGG
jgi:perosamine synthetase